jgi:tRNA(Ile2) C34 agmatinyltransferase TiaS
MKKLCSILTALIMSSFFLTGISLAADKGPAEIVLRSTVNPASKTKLAFFPHAIHQGNFECATCHHGKGDDGKQVSYTEGQEIEKCESCHNKDAVASGMPKELETFKKAAHGLCKECHKKLKAEGKKAGPTKCNGCHRKDLK